MFSDLFYQLWDKGEFLRAIWETVYMTLLSTLVAYGIGLPLGIVLNVTSKGGLHPQRGLNAALGFLVNIFRSIPFIISTVTILGYSAMAGTISGGGLGQIAINYGYQRTKDDIIWVCVVLTVVIVQIIQSLGMHIAHRVDKRVRH